MATNLPKLRYYSVLLKFSPESFAPIHALRQIKESRQSEPFPYLNILANLPLPLYETYKDVLSKIASEKAPIRIKTLTPFATHGRGHHMSRKGQAVVAFGLENGPIEAFRGQIYAELKGAFEAEKARLGEEQAYKLKPKSDYDITVDRAITEAEADKVAKELARTYENGVGELVAESVVLKEYLHKGQGNGAFLEEYRLQGSI